MLNAIHSSKAQLDNKESASRQAKTSLLSSSKFEQAGKQAQHSCEKSDSNTVGSQPGEQLSNLQIQVKQALSNVSLALEIPSVKYGNIGSNGFNANNIASQISNIIEIVDGLIADLSAANKDKQGCPASGQLQGLNDGLQETKDQMPDQTVQMTPDLHDMLKEIGGLLQELQSLMNSRDNHYAQ